MAELRQQLLHATCRWLEAETQWNGMDKKIQRAYNHQCVLVEDILRRNHFQELRRQLLHKNAGAEVTDAQLAALRHEVSLGDHTPQETDFPPPLQAAHQSHQERAAAREERKRVFKAFQQAESAQAGSNSVVGLQSQRQALHQVQKTFKDHPGDVDAMWTALSRARSAGVASRDLTKYEHVLMEAQAKQSFQAQVFSICEMYPVMVSGAQSVGELRQTVANELGWRSQRTRLLFNAKCLMIDSHTLHECGVTHENCDFIVAHIQDEVEDSLESFRNQTELSEASMSKELGTIHMQVPPALRQPETVSTAGKPIHRWTFEMIKVACEKRVMDFPTAASLYGQVEDGLLGEVQARMTIRTSAEGMEGVEGLFKSVDEKYIVQAKQTADQAAGHLSSVAQNLVPVMQQEQAYSKMLAKEMRSWASSSPPKAQRR